MAQNLSNLPLGAKIKYGKLSIKGETPQDIVWLIVAKNHQCTPAYPSNSVTLFAEKMIDRLPFDAKESPDTVYERANYGNNRYSLSNIDQWLNKDGASGLWYEPSYVYDRIDETHKNRSAFLHHFSTFEKNAILPTTIRTKLCSYDGGGYEDKSRKVFLPSASELGVDYAEEGELWSYIANSSAINTTISNQYITYSGETGISKNYGNYWVRTSRDDTTYISRYFASNSGWSHTQPVLYMGIRPAFNLPATLSVSDTTDADGCYTAVWNTSPPCPTIFNVPATVYGGKTNNISWGKVADPDGDTVTYILECAYDGGSFSQIYSGTTTSYNHSVTYGKTSIQYRIKAVDTKGATSSYATSAVKTIVNNRPPVISGTDGNLGVKTNGFTQEYTITDVDDETATVVEKIDGVQIRSYVATNTQWVTLTQGVVEINEGAPEEGGGNFNVVFDPVPDSNSVGKPLKIYIDNTTSGESFVLDSVYEYTADGFSNFGSFTTSNGSTYRLEGMLWGNSGNDGVTIVEAGVTFFIYPYTSDILNVRVDVETESQSGSHKLDTTKTFSVTGDTWLSLSNGVHTMTITASDSFGNSVVRAYTFTKTVTSFTVENTLPMSADTMPTRIALSVSRNIPPEANFKVEVCNNGNDASPAWENATSSVENSLVYVFKNTSKTSSGWGVRVRVTVNRNGAEGACYITAIGGNFE